MGTFCGFLLFGFFLYSQATHCLSFCNSSNVVSCLVCMSLLLSVLVISDVGVKLVRTDPQLPGGIHVSGDTSAMHEPVSGFCGYVQNLFNLGDGISELR